ncbi:MAG: RDD family protein [Thermoanaerobaculia bacterium]
MLTDSARKSYPSPIPPTESSAIREPSLLLLRAAAFLIDALSVAVLLVLPTAGASYAVLWFGGSIDGIEPVWWVALALFLLAILLRDGRGRSPGKRFMALAIRTRSGRPCGWGRSLLRNLPLVITPWNVVEVLVLVFSRSGRRTGDRLARTTVVEE